MKNLLQVNFLHIAFKVLVFFSIFLLVFSFTVFLLILLELRDYSNNKINILISLLPALGILTGSLLAATSVMKSIENAKNLHKIDSDQERHKHITFFAIQIASLYKDFYSLTPNSNSSIDRELRGDDTIHTLINRKNSILKDKDIMSSLKYETIDKFYTLSKLIDKEIIHPIINPTNQDEIVAFEHKFTYAVKENIVQKLYEFKVHLFQTYSSDIKAIELILKEVYENTTF